MSWLDRWASDELSAASWATVSAALRRIPETPAPAGPEWSSPGWSAFASHSNVFSQPSWKLYADAALMLQRYQNSGGADLKLLEEAAESLYAAQANRYFRPASSPSESAALSRELQGHLLSVYRKVRERPPEALRSLESGAATATAGDIGFSQGVSWLQFMAAAPPLAPGATRQLSIDSLRVEWNEQDTAFIFRFSPGEDLELHAYIDLNGVTGAGNIDIIGDPSRAFISARDAWEYALTVSSTSAALHRSVGPKTLGLVTNPPFSWNAEEGSARVTVSRQWLKGHPSRWGYVALALRRGLPKPELAAILGSEAAKTKKEAASGRLRLIGLRSPDRL